MRDDEFEWDDGKAKRNFRDHRVTSRWRDWHSMTRTASTEWTQIRTRGVSAASAGLTIASLW